MLRYKTIVVACFSDDLQHTVHNTATNRLVEQALEFKLLQKLKAMPSTIRVIFVHWMHLPSFPILEDNLVSDVPGVWSDEATSEFQKKKKIFDVWLDEWLNFYRHTRSDFFEDNMLEAETDHKAAGETQQNRVLVQVMPGEIESELGGFLKQHCADLVIISNQKSVDGFGHHNPKTIFLEKLCLPAGREILGSCDLLWVNEPNN